MQWFSKKRVEPQCHCRRVLSSTTSPSSPDACIPITHKWIDRQKKQKHSAVVGGRKVPFLPEDIGFWKHDRHETNNVLCPIDEDDCVRCDGCEEAMFFSLRAKRVCIALTRVHRRHKKVAPETALVA